MMKNTIETLRKQFKVTVAVLECGESIRQTFGGKTTPNKMLELHKMALEELEKESPSLLKLDYLLSKMENEKNNDI